jgi:hypothetical protein
MLRLHRQQNDIVRRPVQLTGTFDDWQMKGRASTGGLHTKSMLSNCVHLLAPADQDDVIAVLLQTPANDSTHSTRTIDHKTHKAITQTR